ncbi:Uncharacterised protein [Mycobacterium tuberculosis]|nr:Uncharacterised protein [Mycobacterium tuberculosis]COV31383.1 Uncharacterised protein [Mycobacterium tuberculosis]
MNRLQQAQFAGIAKPPMRLRDGGGVEVVGVALDQGDVVSVFHEFAGDRAAHRTRSGDSYFHRRASDSKSSLGGKAAMAAASAARPDIAAI